MRHWKVIAVVCFAVMAVAFCCLVLYPEGGEGDRAEPEISGEDPEVENRPGNGCAGGIVRTTCRICGDYL